MYSVKHNNDLFLKFQAKDSVVRQLSNQNYIKLNTLNIVDINFMSYGIT